MKNKIEVAYQDGTKTITGINPDCTTKEVKEYYSNQNFLCSCQDQNYNQVVAIRFFKGFEDMFPGERGFTSQAYYDNKGQCYLF